MARPQVPSASDVRAAVPSSELTERRYIYNGELPTAPTEPHDIAPRGNRAVKRRKRSPFNIITALVVVSLLIVFYVWNKITVNQLLIEVNDLQNQYQKILSTNDVLRADINRKSSLERIGNLATQLGLTNPKEQPVWFDVNNNDLDRLQLK
ncbi:MAG: hypothetical protein HY033_04275 [Ignavibacteriae bacterium]|nr:hypothetical protein [Ignavibacteria bacterium]MBI3364104.1 hypothetical protein [Ignavibacteriota bacterium]